MGSKMMERPPRQFKMEDVPDGYKALVKIFKTYISYEWRSTHSSCEMIGPNLIENCSMTIGSHRNARTAICSYPTPMLPTLVQDVEVHHPPNKW
jgi:hypothetical protein